MLLGFSALVVEKKKTEKKMFLGLRNLQQDLNTSVSLW